MRLSALFRTISIFVAQLALAGSMYAQSDTKDQIRDAAELAACLRLGPVCEYYAIARLTLSPTPTAPADRTDTFLRLPETGEIVANPHAMQFASQEERNRMIESARRLTEQTREAETARYNAALSQLRSRYKARLDELHQRRASHRQNWWPRISACYNDYLVGRIPAAACNALQRQHDEQQRLFNDTRQRLLLEQQEMVERLASQYRK